MKTATIKLTGIGVLAALIGGGSGFWISYHMFPERENTIYVSPNVSTMNDVDQLKWEIAKLEQEVDRWMFYTHIYYTCLADPQSNLAKEEKEYLYKKYVAKVLATCSSIYAEQKNIKSDDHLDLNFLLSKVALLLEEGKIKESDFEDPLGIDWIFHKYPKDSADQTVQTLTMEYSPVIFHSQDSYKQFVKWFYDEVIYYKENRKAIESKHFPYEKILPERFYKRWQKQYGMKYNAPPSPYPPPENE